jgi:hypothetical protein
VNPRGSSISASGLPPASLRIRALTRSSNRPGIVVSKSSRATSAASPSIWSSGSPSSSCSSPDARSANTNPTGSAKSPARDERQRLRGHPVEPLRVVDDAHERLLFGGVGQQAQDRQPDEEAIRRRSGTQAKRRVQRVALRAWQMPATVEHGCAQRVQAGECELHLGLDACRPGDPASPRASRQVPQQGGLADARLAAEDQHTALARAHARDESFQHVALVVTVEQPRRCRMGVEHARGALSRAVSAHARLAAKPSRQLG